VTPHADGLAIGMPAATPELGAPDLRTPRMVEAPAEPVRPFEPANSDQAREQWEAGQHGRARMRRQERAKRTLGERLDAAVLQLRAASGVSASPVGRVSKSAEREGDPGPPRVAEPPIHANLKVIELHVAQLELLLDAERGLVKGSTPGKLTTSEKDALVWELVGVRAEDVAAAFPYLGTSGRAIMRAREREAIRRKVTVRLVDGVVTGRVFDGDETPYDVL
jgi:hypothetical protein